MRQQQTLLFVFLFFFLTSTVFADVYLQSMRGSNNRLDEATRERRNANRLFDSQNNNRGGYNVGSMKYFVGEEVRLEWTNQHGCGNSKLKCDLILQYMCDDLLRDGTSTQTIPNTPEADTDPEYGRHESYAYYERCTTRERNKGLFTASQNLGGNRQTAEHTRQNPNGERHGFECPEERDYYPYWHPNPWKDIAVLTDDMERCENYFRPNSQNVVGYGACFNHTTDLNGNQLAEDGIEMIAINNPISCKLRGHVWVTLDSHGIDAPECVESPWTRVNHLGNTIGGETAFYTWTIPDDVHSRCALRMRYNISTGEYDGFDPAINASLSDREGRKLGLTEFYDSSPNEYLFINNPEVDFGLGANLELAVNTAQYGRTFEDRSHRFSIVPRPEEVEDDQRIVSLSVRGKRGNIVQTFPATEYDFTPNNLAVSTDDLVHLQWTGSNTNNANNDGQGKAQTDRSNLVPIRNLGVTYPDHIDDTDFLSDIETTVNDESRRKFFAFAAENGPGLGQFGGEQSELDDSGVYNNLGLVHFTEPGTHHYMCSRNNNFSNRQQKATINVEEGDGSSSSDLSTGSIIGIVVGVSAGFIAFALVAVAVSIYLRKQKQLASMEQYSPVATEEQSFSNIITDES
mmetsp:Transcript_3013/g.4407  ORF Transcript_3013/g.4407 Transcript_3013/m.4407 type:complete len:629 (+) Transcript_3013:1105-2991(+)